MADPPGGNALENEGPFFMTPPPPGGGLAFGRQKKSWWLDQPDLAAHPHPSPPASSLCSVMEVDRENGGSGAQKGLGAGSLLVAGLDLLPPPRSEDPGVKPIMWTLKTKS